MTQQGRHEISEDEWERIKKYFPERTSHTMGRPSKDSRTMLSCFCSSCLYSCPFEVILSLVILFRTLETHSRKAIKEAYKAAEKIKTQGDRVFLRGGWESGRIIEMWVNVVEKVIETAWPKY